jgi:sporulation protein YhbH
MAVVQPDYDSAPRGRIDAARHREKIREAIRRNLPDIISDQAIITQKGKHVVRVPVRGLKSYRFIHDASQGRSGGFGTGENQKGKVIGRRSKQGRPGKAGEQPGVDYLETEIELEELIEMMLQDLGLPNLRRKEIRESVIPKGWKIDSIEKTGPPQRLDRKRSIKEAIKRTEVLVARLMEESGRDEQECRKALATARGSLPKALELLKDPEFPQRPQQRDGKEEPARIYLDSPDLRYRTIEEDIEYRSNAVILAMMDVSGSMGAMQKYLARSFYFWMLSFLRSIYRRVEIRFIAHTTEAKLVDEQEFFHKGESGGTFCHSAYELAASLVDREYPASRWNIYPFHFSDGEDWDPKRTVRTVRDLLERGISAFGYGEIQSEYSSSVLLETFRKDLGMKPERFEDLRYYEGCDGEIPLLGVVIRSKADLYPALRVFLKPDQAVRREG